ncbi:sushi domain-containing protein 2 [Neosynchiropus ocellatus]
MKNTLLFLGLLLLLPRMTAGQSCRGSCGVQMPGCSCRVTCAALLDCCSDYSQFCLQVAPHSSCMLGGRSLQILDVVFDPGQRLLCRFGGDVTTEGFVDEEGSGRCVTPLLLETGWIRFGVSTDGSAFDRSGEYLSVHPSKADPAFQVALINSTRWMNYGTASVSGRLEMRWDGRLVGAERVNVELWGYRETPETSRDSSRAELRYLYSLARNLSNSGSFSFTPEPSEEFSGWELGNIRVTAASASDGRENVEALWSGAHILAWHLPRDFRDDPAAWAQNRCQQWGARESTLPDFLDELLDCPCTLAQARADKGRFHADYSCDLDGGSVCSYHPGSVHCVRAAQASPSQGAGQQCCYDGRGALVLTGDSAGGSTPDRAHDWGSPPRVPGYSHWVVDVLSFYHCCLWSHNCPLYLKHRPSTGCQNYRPPTAGVVLGDPHFITVGGLDFTFNGRGEYQLVLVPERALSVQIRTEAVRLPESGEANATRLSSVAMKQNLSDIIEVRLVNDSLQVLRNQKVLLFSEQSWMDLKGAFLFSPTRQKVTAMLSSGVAVDVRVSDGNMAATVLLPPEFPETIRGLLGSLSAGVNATDEQVFAFGASWSISKDSSLFTYDSEFLLSSYLRLPGHDPAFVPDFAPALDPGDPLVSDMLRMCSGGGAKFCQYDTVMTRRLEAGNATLRFYQTHRRLVQDLETVVSCGWVPTPKNGKKNGTRYLQGDTLTFSCDDRFSLYGSTQRTCLPDGEWTGQTTHCVTDSILGFVLGAVGSVSALVTMGVMIKRHSRKRERACSGKLEGLFYDLTRASPPPRGKMDVMTEADSRSAT